MNAVMEKTARKRNRRPLLILVALSLLLASAVIYGYERGPLICNGGCLVRTPVIDSKTQKFLENEMAIIDRVPMIMWATGSQYLVCNSTHCTTYTMSFNGSFIGGERKRIEGDDSRGGGEGSGKSGDPFGGSSGDRGDRSGGNARMDEQNDGKGRVTVGRPRK